MFLNEPPQTAYDLNFTLFGVPVRIHPLFWVGSAFFGIELARNEPILLVLWIVAVFVSILVHEMGHAIAIRYFGEYPWVTLTMMGGLASSSRSRRSPKEQFIISVAGPAAQILLAFAVIAIVRATHHRVPLYEIPFWPESFPDLIGGGQPDIRAGRLATLVAFLIIPSIYWAAINLLPVLPLDGGQMARSLLLMTGRGDAWQLSLMLSLVVAVGAAIYGLREGQTFLAILFGVLAYDSFQQLQRLRGGW